VPLTDAPMIDYQFSGIMVQQVLLPLRQKVLKTLYELTHAHTASNWFALFLANFVLLHTYGLLINQQRVFAQCRGANVSLYLSFQDILKLTYARCGIRLCHSFVEFMLVRRHYWHIFISSAKDRSLSISTGIRARSLQR
jgi:hypothetical protein